MKCPKCNSEKIRLIYGGERGEAGPFFYCPDCYYDEEDEIKGETDMVLVKFKVLEHGKNLPSPTYASNGAAGIDLYAALPEEKFVEIGTGGRFLVPTGLAIQLPKGFEAQIRPRSGLAFKHGITILNSPGTIDSDYRGEIKVLLINLGPMEFSFTLKRGDRIAQLVVMPVPTVTLKEVKELDETERGDGGFGSTGA